MYQVTVHLALSLLLVFNLVLTPFGHTVAVNTERLKVSFWFVEQD